MRYALLTLLASGLASADEPKPEEWEVSQGLAQLSQATGCDKASAVVQFVKARPDESRTWKVTLCGLEAGCVGKVSPKGYGYCGLLPASQAKARLSLETGCKPSEIDLAQAIGTSYRLSACGKPYVCSVNRDGANCQPAESQASAQ